MDRHALTAFVTSITARVWQRSPNSTAGSAASSVTLGEVARCSPDEALQRLGSSASGLTTEEVQGAAALGGPERGGSRGAPHDPRRDRQPLDQPAELAPADTRGGVLFHRRPEGRVRDRRHGPPQRLTRLLSGAPLDQGCRRAAADGADQRDRAPAGWRDRARAQRRTDRAARPRRHRVAVGGRHDPRRREADLSKGSLHQPVDADRRGNAAREECSAPRRQRGDTVRSPEHLFHGQRCRQRRRLRCCRAHRRPDGLWPGGRPRSPSSAS